MKYGYNHIRNVYKHCLIRRIIYFSEEECTHYRKSPPLLLNRRAGDCAKRRQTYRLTHHDVRDNQVLVGEHVQMSVVA